MPPNSPIDPFEAARNRGGTPDIRVEWSVRDMQRLRPDWTPQQCAEFLHRHRATFATAMLQTGLIALKAMAADPRFLSIPPPSGHGRDSREPTQKS